MYTEASTCLYMYTVKWVYTRRQTPLPYTLHLICTVHVCINMYMYTYVHNYAATCMLDAATGQDLLSLSQDGFPANEQGRGLIHLTNSLALADMAHLRTAAGGRVQRSKFEVESELLLCKVFLGTTGEYRTPGT